MFLAHVPCAYLVTRRLLKQSALDVAPNIKSQLMRVALVAAALPDLDLIYFYAFDGRQTHHHLYWTHVPFFWCCVGLVLWLAHRVLRLGNRNSYLVVFMLNIGLHLVLDTVVGGIAWLAPFSSELIRWIDIAPQHAWWIDNFIWHGSFGVELLITYAAVAVWAHQRPARAAGTRVT